MLAKLMAFIKCQIAILSGLLETIADNTGNPHPEHTNIVKVNEVCVKGPDGPMPVSVWSVWNQHSSASIGTIYLDELGVQVGTIDEPPATISDCDCIDAIECCPEAEIAVEPVKG